MGLWFSACPVIAAAAAPGQDQDLSPADYPGYHLGHDSGYGSAMVSGGEWMAVGAPGTAMDSSSSYTGGRVVLWRRVTGPVTSSGAGPGSVSGTPTVAISSTGTTWVIHQQLIWPDADAGTDAANAFGRRLSMDATGTRLLVGSSPHLQRAHVFRRSTVEGTEVWTLEGTLHAQSGSAAADAFGEGMVISSDGQAAAIGSPGPDVYQPTFPGYVNVFALEAATGTWVHASQLTDPGNGARLGRSLAMHGHTLYAGRPWAEAPPLSLGGFENEHGGKITVFERTGTTLTWARSREITSPDPYRARNESFGYQIQILGDRLWSMGRPTGGTRATELSISGGYTFVSTLSFYMGDDTLLALDTDRVAVGTLDSRGDVEIHHRVQGTPHWQVQNDSFYYTSHFQQHSLLWSDGELLSGGYWRNLEDDTTRDWTVRSAYKVGNYYQFFGQRQPLTRHRMDTVKFGHSVAGDDEGNWLAVGAPDLRDEPFPTLDGLIYLYRRDAQGRFQYHSQLTPSPSALRKYPLFGSQVVMSGGRLAIGPVQNSETSRLGVQTYVWDAGQDRWLPEALALNPWSSSEGDFGQRVALHGDLLAVSVTYRVEVYVYRRSGAQWVLEAEIDRPSSAGDTEIFGSSVAVSDTTVLVGSPGTPSAGAAYFFEKNFLGQWKEVTRVTRPAGAAAWERFGTSVALYGIRALVGRQGSKVAGSVYNRGVNGGPWKPHSAIPAPGTLGGNLCLDGDLAAFASTSNQANLISQAKGSTWTSLPMGGTSITRGMTFLGDLVLVGGTEQNTVQVRSLSARPSIAIADESHTRTTTEDGVVHLDLGEFMLGAKTAPLFQMTLANSSIFPMQVTATLSGEGAADFNLPVARWDLPAGAEKRGSLSFTPKTTGAREITLTMASSAQNAQPQVFVIHVQVVSQAQVQDLTFTRQPQSRLISRAGPDATLSATVQGTRPITYRWLKNGTAVSGATLPELATKQAGRYRLEATNPAGKFLSDEVILGTYTLKTPSPQIIPQGKPVDLLLEASSPLLHVQWWKTGLDGALDTSLSADVSISGTGKAALKISPSQLTHTGRYEARISQPVPGGGPALTAVVPLDLHIVRPLVATLDTLAEEMAELSPGDEIAWKCGVEFDAPMSLMTLSFTVTGLPPGLKHAGTTGAITGTPTTTGLYKVSITARLGSFTSAPLVRQILVKDYLLSTPGKYWGWIPPEEGLIPLGGAVMLDLQPSGSFSASYQIGAQRGSLAGALNEKGDFASKPTRMSVTYPGGAQIASVEQDNDTTLMLYIQPVDEEDGYGIGTCELRLVQPLAPASPPPPEALGKHLFALVPIRGHISGSGYGTITISAERRATIAGVLPDGSTLTGTGWYADRNYERFLNDPCVCIYLLDSTRKGSLKGSPSMPSLPDTPYSVSLEWDRLPIPGRTYPEGFWADLDLFTSRYDPKVPALSPAPGAYALGLTLPTVDTTTTYLTLSPKLSATFGPRPADFPIGTGLSGPAYDEANPWAIKLTVTPSTGLFSGQFTLIDSDPLDPAGIRTVTRIVPYRGIWLPQHGVAFGHFRVPELPDPYADPPQKPTATPIRSGSVYIYPDSAPN